MAEESKTPRQAAGRTRKKVSAPTLTQILLDSTPLICAVWDEDGQLIDCNLEMLRLLKIKNKADVMKRFFDFSPEFQPDGRESKEKGLDLIHQALFTGHQSFQWEYRTADGDALPTETMLVRVKWEEGFRILAYSRDLRELNEAKEQERLAMERATVMLDTLPLATYIVASDFQVIDCNKAAVRLFRANDKEHVIHAFLEDFSPRFQPDGEPSGEKARGYMRQAFEDGGISFEWTHQMANGEIIPCQITLVRVRWNDDVVLSAYARDLRDVIKVEKEVHQREAYLRTVNTIAEWLLSANPQNAEAQIQKSMEFLAASMHLDGIKIWMNSEQGGGLFYSLYKCWPVEDAAQWPDKYAYSRFPFWKDSMMDNRAINSFVSDLPRAEHMLLKAHGIKSILALPLLVEGEFWGFLSLEDGKTERVFMDAEENMLRSTGSLFVSTIVRNRAVGQMIRNNYELRKKSLLLSSVNRVAELMLGSEKKDFPLIIQRALKLLGESVGATRASLWVTQSEGDPLGFARRISGWKRGKAFSEMEHGVTVKLRDYTPEWDAPVEELADIEENISEMNANLRRFVLLQGSKTLLVIPLAFQERLWGFVGFAFDESGHRSTDEERSILRSGSVMIAESIIRKEIVANMERVEEEAVIDHLTGLLTRAGFMRKARPLFTKCQKEGTNFSLLFLDVDHFKMVNDQYGHAFGDLVLAHFAEVIQGTTRPNDICCRYGGEEVVVILADSSPVVTEKVARRMLQEVRVAIFDGHVDFKLTVSIGMVTGVPLENERLSTYLERADTALYAAKNRGRDQIVDYASIAPDTGVSSAAK